MAQAVRKRRQVGLSGPIATDTIFALSSGAPPAAIALVRVSGPGAFAAGRALTGGLPAPRRAGLRRLRDRRGAALDDALVLTFLGPATATGEDLLELHLHGGRAVVRAVLGALAEQPGLRAAEAGEFTRRALANGRIDLAQAEGLADLLEAESETARRLALIAAEGGVSRAARAWTERLVTLAARTEAQIDFADEDDVPAEAQAIAAIRSDVAALAAELLAALSRPAVERLRDGFRIVFAGPPNAGKSSLVNALAEREVAIATPVAGTTRDRLEAPVLRDGVGYLLIDVAGLRDEAADPVEAIGIDRARAAMAAADLIIWLGDDEAPAPGMLAIHARADLVDRPARTDRPSVSASTGMGVAALWERIAAHCATLLPTGDSVAFNARQRDALAAALQELSADDRGDAVLLGERLRRARSAIDRIAGTASVEAMLDDLFGRFCIGK